jgi:hypothetical protein
MTTQHNFREEAGLRFTAILVGGIVATLIVLTIVVALFGHFAAPDPGLI